MTIATTITVHRATLADAAAIADIHQRAWRVTHRRWVEASEPERIVLDDRLALWHGVLAEARWPVTVAERDGTIVGFIHVLPCRDHDRDPGVTAEISALYVADEHQRQGLGGALLVHVLCQLPAQGFRCLSLWVGAYNHVARRFYQAHGFEDDGGTKVFARTGLDGMRYVRLIGAGKPSVATVPRRA